MRKIDKVSEPEKKTKKWANVEIDEETLKKVQKIPKTVNQNEFIDSLVLAGLKAGGLD